MTAFQLVMRRTLHKHLSWHVEIVKLQTIKDRCRKDTKSGKVNEAEMARTINVRELKQIKLPFEKAVIVS